MAELKLEHPSGSGVVAAVVIYSAMGSGIGGGVGDLVGIAFW